MIFYARVQRDKIVFFEASTEDIFRDYMEKRYPQVEAAYGPFENLTRARSSARKLMMHLKRLAERNLVNIGKTRLTDIVEIG